MAIWTKGQSWRVTNSLNTLNQQVRAYAPRSVPPATPVDSWGALADDAHSASSDHYPHYYTALGSTAVVCARDFPHAPALGLDGGVVTEHMRRARDARVGYIIFNRRITGPNHGWLWDPYDGDDPHDTHFHVSGVHTAIADSTTPWSLPGGLAAADSTKEGESMSFPILRIVGIDNANKPSDIFGNQVPNNGLVFASPQGRISVTASWWGSMDPLAPGGSARPSPVIMTVTWVEAQKLCDSLIGANLVIDQATQDALALACAQAVKDSLGASGALEARLTAWALSPEGRAALVAAANVAEDS